jgi:hypothetical protein
MTDMPKRPPAGSIKTTDMPQRPPAPPPKMIDMPQRPPAGPIKTTPTKYTPPIYDPRPLVGTPTDETVDTLTTAGKAYAAAAEAYADAIERADVSALSREQARAMLQLLEHCDAAAATLRRAITVKGKRTNGQGKETPNGRQDQPAD